MAPNVGDETTVNDSYSVTVPAVVREQADIGAGDEIRWAVDEGTLSVEIIKQRVGVSNTNSPDTDDYRPTLGVAAQRPHMAKQPHILCEPGDVTDVALLPGDPDRVDRIAAQCDRAETVARNREYEVVNATYEGRELTICSTGIGAPSAAIAVEELAAVGVETFLRVGTTGALQRGIEIGDMVVATGAAKDEGTTKRYESATVPAVPDYDVLAAVVETAEARGEEVHVGPIATDDAFYAEGPYVEDWEAAGLLSVEMEAAAIFALARRKGLRAGAICTVDGNLVEGTQKGETEDDELPEKAKDNVERAIGIALDAVGRL